MREEGRSDGGEEMNRTCVYEVGGVVVFIVVFDGAGLRGGELLVFDFFELDHGCACWCDSVVGEYKCGKDRDVGKWRFIWAWWRFFNVLVAGFCCSNAKVWMIIIFSMEALGRSRY